MNVSKEPALKKAKTDPADDAAASSDTSYPLPPLDPRRKAFGFFMWQFCSCFVIDWNLAADLLIEENRWSVACEHWELVGEERNVCNIMVGQWWLNGYYYKMPVFVHNDSTEEHCIMCWFDQADKVWWVSSCNFGDETKEIVYYARGHVLQGAELDEMSAIQWYIPWDSHNCSMAICTWDYTMWSQACFAAQQKQMNALHERIAQYEQDKADLEKKKKEEKPKCGPDGEPWPESGWMNRMAALLVAYSRADEGKMEWQRFTYLKQKFSENPSVAKVMKNHYNCLERWGSDKRFDY
jgi:hypothetical protein